MKDAVLLWRKGQPLTRLGGTPSVVHNLACAPDGRRVVTGGWRVIDLVSGSVVPLRTSAHGSYLLPREAAWRRDGREIALRIGYDLHRFDSHTGVQIGEPRRAPNHEDWEVSAISGAYAYAKRVPYGRVFDVFRVERDESVLELDEIWTHTEISGTLASVASDEDGRWVVKWMDGTLEVRDLRARKAWSSMIGGPNRSLSLSGDALTAATYMSIQRWNLSARQRTLWVGIPADEARPWASALSHASDRVLLPSGRIASLKAGAIVSDGAAGLGHLESGYSGGCWGESDRFVVLAARNKIVLHRLADGMTLLVYQFVVGEAVELLVMTPDGTFDASDELLKTVWYDHDGQPTPLSALARLRSPGLLARFHARE